MLEHGYQQGPAVRDILIKNGFADVKTYQDYAKLDRFSVGCLPE